MQKKTPTQQKLKEAIRPIIESILKEYEDIPVGDWYLGKYDDMEQYKKLLARGILAMFKEVADDVNNTNLKKRNPLSTVIKLLYKDGTDTVDAVDAVLHTYYTDKVDKNYRGQPFK